MQDPSNYVLTGEPVTHQVVADIDNFRSRENLPEKFTFEWLRKLTPCLELEPDKVLKSCMKQMMSAYTTLMKQKKQEPLKLAVFLSQPSPTTCTEKHRTQSMSSRGETEE